MIRVEVLEQELCVAREEALREIDRNGDWVEAQQMGQSGSLGIKRRPPDRCVGQWWGMGPPWNLIPLSTETPSTFQ